MKQLQLLACQKDSPSRRERLALFKNERGIETHDCGKEFDQSRWMAVALAESKRRFSSYLKPTDKSLFDVIVNCERLISEAGLMGFGPTEIDAVNALCRENSMEGFR